MSASEPFDWEFADRQFEGPSVERLFTVRNPVDLEHDPSRVKVWRLYQRQLEYAREHLGIEHIPEPPMWFDDISSDALGALNGTCVYSAIGVEHPTNVRGRRLPGDELGLPGMAGWKILEKPVVDSEFITNRFEEYQALNCDVQLGLPPRRVRDFMLALPVLERAAKVRTGDPLRHVTVQEMLYLLDNPDYQAPDGEVLCMAFVDQHPVALTVEQGAAVDINNCLPDEEFDGFIVPVLKAA